MAYQDIIQKHIPDGVKTSVITKLDEIRTALKPYLQNLTEEENNRYGSIDEKNKLFVNKDFDYFNNQPALSSPDVDWDEFAADFADRAFLENIATQTDGLKISCLETKRCHDYDNYQNALIDKKYTDYKSETGGGSGFDKKSDDLGGFFK